MSVMTVDVSGGVLAGKEGRERERRKRKRKKKKGKNICMSELLGSELAFGRDCWKGKFLENQKIVKYELNIGIVEGWA
jgi:hypothetical protein